MGHTANGDFASRGAHGHGRSYRSHQEDYEADFVVLDADPLENIRAVDRVYAVINNGEPYRRSDSEQAGGVTRRLCRQV